MARTLDVYIGDDIAGQLVQDDGGQMPFRYAEAWLNKPEAVSLSQSLKGSIVPGPFSFAASKAKKKIPKLQ
jgi:HipA-like protein